MNTDAIPPQKKDISITQWRYIFLLTVFSWVIFITVLLFIMYYPPPDSSNSIIGILCEGLRFFTYTMTGVTCGYPIGKGAASASPS